MMILMVSNGRKPEMLLNILPYKGESPTKKKYWAQKNFNSAKTGRSWFKEWSWTRMVWKGRKVKYVMKLEWLSSDGLSLPCSSWMTNYLSLGLLEGLSSSTEVRQDSRRHRFERKYYKFSLDHMESEMVIWVIYLELSRKDSIIYA